MARTGLFCPFRQAKLVHRGYQGHTVAVDQQECDVLRPEFGGQLDWHFPLTDLECAEEQPTQYVTIQDRQAHEECSLPVECGPGAVGRERGAERLRLAKVGAFGKSLVGMSEVARDCIRRRKIKDLSLLIQEKQSLTCQRGELVASGGEPGGILRLAVQDAERLAFMPIEGRDRRGNFAGDLLL